CDELAQSGWHVREHLVSADRQVGVPAHRTARLDADVAAALQAGPVDTRRPRAALVDGLLASAATEPIMAAAALRPIVVVMHMPFGLNDPLRAAREREMLWRV